MQAVLISIQPYWCNKIIQLIKTLELRKNAPLMKPPFKCYIYCTMGNELIHTEPVPYCNNVDGSTVYVQRPMNGKVIGEFICDYIEQVSQQTRHLVSEKSCVPLPDMYNYAGPKGLSGLKAWHISELKIYEKPKSLSEFSRHDSSYDNTFGWAFEDRKKSVPIKRPPQSWCYVQQLSA